MLPILVISNDTKRTGEFIKKFVKENNISSYTYFTVEKEKTSITIEQMRQVGTMAQRLGHLKPLFVIKDFHTARQEAQNAFLKTLEETAQRVYFILICQEQGVPLETIQSRCRIVRFPKSQETTASEKNGFSLKNLLQTHSGLEKNRDKAIVLCDALLAIYREELKEGKVVTPILKEILQVRRLIDKNNLSPQLGIDHLLLQIDAYAAN